jgi:hypothetical protein
MGLSSHKPSHLSATVTEVLPTLGLAYLTGDDESSWAVTKSTNGVGLDALRPGSRVDLTIVQQEDFAVVSEYATLD